MTLLAFKPFYRPIAPISLIAPLPGAETSARARAHVILLAVGCSFAIQCAHRPSARQERPDVHVLGMRVDGRYVLEAASDVPAPSDQASLRVGYSLTHLQWNTMGGSVWVCAEDLPWPGAPGGGNRFAVTVDEVSLPDFFPPASPACLALAEGLPERRHRIQLTKRNETKVGGTRFWAPPGHVGVPPAAARKILVVGDSISCGYGNLCSGPHEHFSPETQDATRSYVAELGHAFAASVEVVAFSGRGVWRNRDATLAGTLPELFVQALPGSLEPVRRPALADATLILLGTNDFANPAVDEADFVRAYQTMLREVEADSPDAALFVGLGPMLTDRVADGSRPLSQARRLLQGIVSKRPSTARAVTFIEFPPQGETPASMLGFGCDYHPNVATHRAMARQLIDIMGPRLGWDAATAPPTK